jgi:tripeptidyl-peptidase-1
LKTEYKVYESKADMSKRSLATDEYSVPLAVRDHIDFITPTVQFGAALSERSVMKRAVPDIEKMVLKTKPIPNLIPGQARPYAMNSTSSMNNNAAFDPADLSICDQYITTECLRALYNMPNGTLASSSLQIVEYTPQSFIPDDLAIYLSAMDPWIPSTTQPCVDFVDGAELVEAAGDNSESNLDLQLAVPLGKLPLTSLTTRALSDISSLSSGSHICSSRRHNREW